mgnify:CR=1 FL=1
MLELTPEEIAVIEKYRKDNEESKPVKTGILKHDLYDVDDLDFTILNSGNQECSGDYFITMNDFEEMISKMKKDAKVLVEKGTKFSCYINDYNEEAWEDDDGYIECASKKWAEKNLDKIKKI